MKIKNLRCEYRENPLGIDILRPRLSWQLDSDQRGACQQAFQVVAANDKDSLLRGETVLWDSGRVDSDQSIHVPYAGPSLQSRQRVYWRARVWDERDQPTAWSAPAWFEMGLLDPGDWQAQWVGNPLVGGPRTTSPCPYFRREFTLDEKPVSARLYVTALGLYEASINGQRVGADIFTPGWTDYRKRLQYQTYDVADLLAEGPNAFGALLGDGWYCGYVAWEARQNYGDRPKLLAQLEIEFASGRRQMIATDESWRTATGALLEADLIMGEACDARLALENWADGAPLGESQAKRWQPAIPFSHPSGLTLVAQNTPTVRAQGELTPVAEPALRKNWPENNWIFDFGQNLVGRVRLKVKGKRGATITLRFGEMLDEKGNLYTQNLRSARQTDYYTLKGDPAEEVYESCFTFHGFRYVEARGLPGKPSRGTLTAIVLHSENAPAIEFECSDPLVNQLQHNIRWGWKGNSLEIPTDCPQRDERLGWTGDAQVFAKTATYLTDAAGFFSKWIQDLADAQFDYGAIPAVAPVTPSLLKSDGGPAWSDAFIILPWTIWQQYGDTRVLETHYEAMRRYVDYLVENSPGLIRLLPGSKELDPEREEEFGGYGDWLAQDGSSDRRGLTPRDLIGTAFLAYDARLMAQMAEAIGKPQDAAEFRQLFEDVRTAFINRFITSEGSMTSLTQTSNILALHFGLAPEKLRPAIVAALVEDIEIIRKMHMSTGFVGTPYICQTLTDAGRFDLAYALLLQKTFPSWLYSVLHGATTIWERWDGWTKEGGFHDPAMNSFNHYAYGAVGTWMVENMAGIRTDPENPGFKRIILQPRIPPQGKISHAGGEYQSPYGLIQSHWRMESDSLIWEVTVPPNATAEAHIPAGPRSRISEGAAPIEESPGVEFLRQTSDAAVYELQSGRYAFQVPRR